MKKIAQFAVMSLMMTALFSGFNTPAIAGVNGPVAANPMPMPMCAPDDPTCDPGPFWPKLQATANANPMPMPMCAPDDKLCDPGPFWPR
jgi:hypothetical protein